MRWSSALASAAIVSLSLVAAAPLGCAGDDANGGASSDGGPLGHDDASFDTGGGGPADDVGRDAAQSNDAGGAKDSGAKDSGAKDSGTDAGRPGGGGGGGGGGGTDAATCAASSGDPACDPCLSANCCQSAVACEAKAECAAIVRCIETTCEKGDTGCLYGCFTAHPGGQTEATALGTCLNDKCPSVCGF